jgi:uncharacterized protein (DUF362 family)
MTPSSRRSWASKYANSCTGAEHGNRFSGLYAGPASDLVRCGNSVGDDPDFSGIFLVVQSIWRIYMRSRLWYKIIIYWEYSPKRRRERRRDLTVDNVALVKCENNVEKTLEGGLELIGGFGTFRSPVLIKPNICTFSDTTGYACTNVEVVEALIRLILSLDSNLSIRIVESDSENKFAEKAFKKFGYTRLEADMQREGFDVSLVDLSHSPVVRVPFEGMYFRDPELPEIITKPHYVISIGVAKTHALAFITGTLKNLFGLLPRKNKASYHSQINEIIVDLNRLIQPDLCIVDARVGLEGWNGTRSRRLDTFILGKKPVSVDATMARAMGFEPESIRHVVEASKYDLGALNPTILGQTIESVKVQFDALK